MKLLLNSAILGVSLIISTAQFAQTALYQWSGLYSGSSSSSRANAMQWSTPNVGQWLITCGEFTGTIDADLTGGIANLISQGGSDIFITRKDAITSTLAWAISIGSTGDDKALAMARTSDYNLIVGGSFSGTVDFDPGPGSIILSSAGGTDGFLMKVDIATGNVLWAVNAASGPGNEAVTVIGTNDLNQLTVGGTFAGTIDLNPTAGNTNVTSSGGLDIFVSRFTTNGTFNRGTAFGGPNDDLLYDATTGGAAKSVICGGVYTQIDLDPGPGTQLLTATDTTMFLLSLDSTLNYSAHGFLTTTKPGKLIFAEGINRIVVAGSFKDSLNIDMTTISNYRYSRGGYDGFAISFFDHINLIVDAYTYGGTGDDIVTTMGASYNHIIVAGTTNSSTFEVSTPSDTIQIGGSGNDIFGFVLDHLNGVIENTGLAPNGSGNRTPTAGATRFGASGYNIWLSGALSGTSDFDPTPSTQNLTATSSVADAFELSWSPCATIYVQTGISVCDTIVMYNNILHPVPSTYYDTLSTVCGADSIVRVDFILQLPPDTSVTVNNLTLVSPAVGVQYQWVDCTSNYAPIPGAMSQTFTPAVDGNYAVIVTNNCGADTSACYAIIGIGISENTFSQLQISPNPFNEVVVIRQAPIGAVVTLTSILGQEMQSLQVSDVTTTMATDALPPGTYLLRITYQEQTQTTKLVK